MYTSMCYVLLRMATDTFTPAPRTVAGRCSDNIAKEVLHIVEHTSAPRMEA